MNKLKQRRRVDIEQPIAGAAIIFVLFILVELILLEKGYEENWALVLGIIWGIGIPSVAWWIVIKKK